MDISGLPLADALFVLAHKPDGSRLIQHKFLKIGLGGAVLTDLVAHRRVSLDNGKVVPDETGTVPSGLLGEYDAMVRGEARPRSAKHWVRAFRSADIEERVAKSVQNAGIATSEHDSVLGFIPIVRYAPDPATFDALKTRVSTVLGGRATTTEWDASFIGLCDATGVLGKVFPGIEKSAVKAITEGEWASEAVRKVIKQANAAVRNAIIATVNANNGSQGF